MSWSVDDHPLFREGLKTLIDRSPDFCVVAEAGSGKEAFEKVMEARPDIVLVDITMPGMSGIQLIRELRETETQIRFMVVSMHSNVDYIVEAFRAGATGYMVKDSAGEGLFKGLSHRGPGRGVSGRVPCPTTWSSSCWPARARTATTAPTGA